MESANLPSLRENSELLKRAREHKGAAVEVEARDVLPYWQEIPDSHPSNPDAPNPAKSRKFKVWIIEQPHVTAFMEEVDSKILHVIPKHNQSEIYNLIVHAIDNGKRNTQISSQVSSTAAATVSAVEAWKAALVEEQRRYGKKDAEVGRWVQQQRLAAERDRREREIDEAIARVKHGRRRRPA